MVLSRPAVVAVIPARAGSKGVTAKNLRPVGGVPLVARAVAAARAAERIDHVAVSTDSVEIAAIARDAGALVVDRPAGLADDSATSESALLHALDALAERGVRADILVFLQATSPFIDPEDLDAAVERVASGRWDVVFSATPTHAFVWRMGAHGAEAVGHDASRRPRRQDREQQYRETGAFYVMAAAGFRRAGFRFFGRIGLQETDERLSLEIDAPHELELADVLARTILPSRLVTSKGLS